MPNSITSNPPAMRTLRLRNSAVTLSAARPVASNTGHVPSPNASINNALSSALPWLADHNRVL
ncbi:hypothetical protein D3C76_1727660 [compost metagenome]